MPQEPTNDRSTSSVPAEGNPFEEDETQSQNDEENQSGASDHLPPD